jgi:hypothetical protein
MNFETVRSKISATCIRASVTKKGYQPRTDIVNYETGNLVTDFHNILARWRKHFCQLLNACEVNNVRQTEVLTVEPLAPEPSAFEVEMITEKLREHKSTYIYQIPAELIEAVGRTFRPEVHEIINSIWNKEMPEEWKESIILPIFKNGDKTDLVIIEAYHFCQQSTKLYPTSYYQG